MYSFIRTSTDEICVKEYFVFDETLLLDIQHFLLGFLKSVESDFLSGLLLVMAGRVAVPLLSSLPMKHFQHFQHFLYINILENRKFK
tara:strand:+ start:142 stop:402 length:261 start_codon:yes stop_codon:yes gene_type:complete